MRKENSPLAELRPLPYPPEALEPTLDKETVKVHHGVHQAKYVAGWNKHVENPKTLGDYEALVFNGAGVILHEMYWENLGPLGESPSPSQELFGCINRCFGSPQDLINQMTRIGTAIEGSGWVVLAWIPRFERLVILPAQNQALHWIPGAVPIIVLDVWEHAYYLQYQSNREEYLRFIWHNVDWGVASERYEKATAE